MQTIEVSNCQIKYITANVKSKIRDGEHAYILSADDISNIINRYVQHIDFLNSVLKNKNKPMKVENELCGEYRETGNKFGGGYGD